MSDRCLIDVDPIVLVIWGLMSWCRKAWTMTMFLHRSTGMAYSCLCENCVFYPLHGHLVLWEISWTSIEIMTWISNHIYVKQWDVLTPPCPNLNGGLVRLPLKLGHGWVIASQRKHWIYLLNYANYLLQFLLTKGAPNILSCNLCNGQPEKGAACAQNSNLKLIYRSSSTLVPQWPRMLANRLSKL